MLIELVAVAVHAIAVELFKLDSHGPHKKDTPCPINDPHAHAEPYVRLRFPPWPTSFAVNSYTDVEQYPDGFADLAGYWAECLIFGGVVLFGRGESDTGVGPTPCILPGAEKAEKRRLANRILGCENDSTTECGFIHTPEMSRDGYMHSQMTRQRTSSGS